MSRYHDHNRARNKTVSFRLTPEEYRQMEERIKITGFPKNEFMIRSMLESDRLSLEVRRLKDVLNGVKVPEEAVDLLLECRALMEQLIQITNAEKEELYDR